MINADVTITITIDNEDISLAYESLTAEQLDQFHSAVLLENKTGLSDRFVRELLKGSANPNEFDELVQTATDSTLRPNDFDQLLDSCDAVRLAENADQIVIYSDLNDWIDGNEMVLEEEKKERNSEHLSLNQLAKDYIADDEYLYVLSDGAIAWTGNV